MGIQTRDCCFRELKLFIFCFVCFASLDEMCILNSRQLFQKKKFVLKWVAFSFFLPSTKRIVKKKLKDEQVSLLFQIFILYRLLLIIIGMVEVE